MELDGLTEKEITLARQLRDILTKKGHTDLDPVLLVQYVIVVKGRMDDCVKRFEKYVKIKQDNKLSEVTVEDANAELATDMWMPSGAHDGAPIFSMTYKDWDPTLYRQDGNGPILDAKTAPLLLGLLRLMDAMQCSIREIRKGTIWVADCLDMSWSNFDRELEEKFSGLYSQCYPMRFAALPTVDGPWYLTWIISICQYFMSAKLIQRIELVTRETLFNKYPKDQLPVSLGGTFPQMSAVDYINARLERRQALARELDTLLNSDQQT